MPRSRRVLTVEMLGALKIKAAMYAVNDARKNGLRIEVTPQGTKTWYWLRWVPHEGRMRRIKIGRYPEVKLGKARELAGKFNDALPERKDPEKYAFGSPAGMTVSEAWKAFLADPENTMAPRTKRFADWQMKRHVLATVGDLDLDELDRPAIVRVLSQAAEKTTLEDGRASGGPVAHNRVRAALSAMCSWAVRQGLLASNPVTTIKPKKESGRDRYLTERELPKWWEAVESCEDEVTRDVVTMLLATGQRLGNVLTMRWSDLDLGSAVWTIPAGEFKSRREHKVPLIPAAVDVLESREKSGEFVFPGSAGGPRKSIRGQWRELASGLKDLHPHDLRRTTASWLAQTGTDHAIIVTVLGHAPSILGVTGRYVRIDLERQRTALERAWEAMRGGDTRGKLLRFAGGKQ